MYHILVLFCFVLNSEAANLTYIVNKEDVKVSLSCLAEESERYAGIGWIYPIPTDYQRIPIVVNRYIPNIYNDFNCKFTPNDHCNTIWSLKNWYIDNSSPKSRELLTDTRWEDFPILFISNTTKEFDNKYEFDKDSSFSFSVRGNGFVEIIISAGINPYKHQCYYFNIGNREVHFKKYDQLPEVIGDYQSSDSYKAYTNIISSESWRSFTLNSNSKTGLLELIDVNLNRVMIQQSVDNQILSNSYVFIRSSNVSLWKIHQNSFLYTEIEQVSRLGPQLHLPNKDLCISLLVKICSHCEMTFLYMNGTNRRILKRVGPTVSGGWTEIKLKEEKADYLKLNLFVETKFVNKHSNVSIGFWAIDNVRVCHENEIKVSYLKLNNEDVNITCQFVKNPSWKPKKIVYEENTGSFNVPEVVPTTNSIRLMWTHPTKFTNYIYYQGNDHCNDPRSLTRIKSNGFVTATQNRIILSDLLPYTNYNITLSNPIQDVNHTIIAHTLETADPNLDELPTHIQIKPKNSSVFISWDKVDCWKQSGRLVHTLIVSNSTLNFTKTLSIQTNTSYEITDLKPYTRYKLTILTARNARNLYNMLHTSNYTLDFATMPGVADAPRNLEIYSIDNSSAILRYDLPIDSYGTTREVQVMRCNSLSFGKCKSSISLVKRCGLWLKKYCVQVNYLIPEQKYTFRVSLKNLNTAAFGKESMVKAVAHERVPGKPTNITYKMVDCSIDKDYCNMNITWLHPYYQNGTITAFEIILNSTTNDKYINDIYAVPNKTYYYDYTYQIKNLLYSNMYTLYIRSINDVYKSDYVTLEIKTDDLSKHIDQKPKLLQKGSRSLKFKIPDLDSRLESYRMTVAIQDYNKDSKPVLKDRKIDDNLCHPYGNVWISQNVEVNTNNKELVIENRLEPNNKYCIIFIITDRYKGVDYDVVYHEKIRMSDSDEKVNSGAGASFNHLYILLLMLLAVPAGFLIYRYLRKRNVIKNPTHTNESLYETLPCEDIDNTNKINT